MRERCTKPDGGRIECSWFTADHLELPNTVSDEEARDAADALVGPPLSGAVQDAYCGGGL